MSRWNQNRRHRFRARYGPWALVTGASSGIGRGFARELAAAGLDLVLVARREPVLRDFAAELVGVHGVRTEVLALDLATESGVDNLLAATVGTDIGLYIAAAGFGTSGPFLDGDLVREREMLHLNAEAVLTTTHVLARRMTARGRGGIILMSSIVGFQGMPNAAHYAATKAYVQTLAEALHRELRPHGVDVLASAPGPTRSGFADVAGMRMGQALSPSQVARGTLAALGRRPTALPGLLSRVLASALAPLPRTARIQIMGSVMATMIRDQTNPPPAQVPVPSRRRTHHAGGYLLGIGRVRDVALDRAGRARQS